LGLVPRRYQSREVDYTGGISKCGDRRIKTLLYEAANVMLTRYNGQLRLKDWAFARTGRFQSLREARLQWPSMAVRRRSPVTSAIKNWPKRLRARSPRTCCGQSRTSNMFVHLDRFICWPRRR
jgi:hypothetical protein